MTLHIASLKKLFHIDPLRTDAVCHPLSSLLYQTLLRINRSGDQPVAELASSWTYSADHSKWSFDIGATFFDDGSPLLASHVVQSFARHIWPCSTSIFAGLLRGLIVGATECSEGEIPAGLYADDAQGHVFMHLRQPYCPLLEIIAHPAMGICVQTQGNLMMGSGPMRVWSANDNEIQLAHNPVYSGQRKLPEKINIQLHDKFDDVCLAIQDGRANAALLERKHQLRLDALPGMHTTKLRDRWSGMLILNAAGVFDELAMRKDFHALVQKEAQEKLGVLYHTDFIPADVLAVPTTPASKLTLKEFRQRWAGHFSTTAVRILYAAGRGPLTVALDVAISVLRACGIHCELILTKNAEQVYDYVARGEFDVAARGWIQDFDDADEYVGAYQKQAPQQQAQAAYVRFYATLAEYRHIADADARSAAYAQAVKTLDEEYLCITVCRDHHRIFHDSCLHLQSLCRDPFDL